jgi:hypothetical protein
VDKEDDQDSESEKLRLAGELNYRTNSQAYSAHRDIAEITDKRSKFY